MVQEGPSGGRFPDVDEFRRPCGARVLPLYEPHAGAHCAVTVPGRRTDSVGAAPVEGNP